MFQDSALCAMNVVHARQYLRPGKGSHWKTVSSFDASGTGVTPRNATLVWCGLQRDRRLCRLTADGFSSANRTSRIWAPLLQVSLHHRTVADYFKAGVW